MTNVKCPPCNDLAQAEITARGGRTGEVCTCTRNCGHPLCLARGGQGWSTAKPYKLCPARPGTHGASRYEVRDRRTGSLAGTITRTGRGWKARRGQAGHGIHRTRDQAGELLWRRWRASLGTIEFYG